MFIMKKLFYLLFVTILFSCSSNESCEEFPTLSTDEVNNLFDTSVTISGKIITPTCDETVTSQGFVYGEENLPTVEDSKIVKSGSSISASLNNLKQNTTYYIRTFFENPVGVFYGNEVSFTTNVGDALSNSVSVMNIKAFSADILSEINTDGGGEISSRGVCWSTSQNPTVEASKTEDGTGIGSFKSNLTGLTHNTEYYVRTYAINEAGTTYGEEVSFTTRDGIATITTIAITDITKNSATSGGTITDDGGAETTLRGVCWSVSPNPTINDFKTNDGEGVGEFSSSLTNLISNTTYYVRSYSINELGVTYGNEVEFKTDCDEPTGNISYDITRENGIISFNFNYEIELPSVNYNVQSIKLSFNDNSNNSYEKEININQLNGSDEISNLPPKKTFSNIKIEVTSSDCGLTNIYPSVTSFETPALYDVGDLGEGGIIIYMNSNGINGIAVSDVDAGEGNWACDTSNSQEDFGWYGYSTFGNTINDWIGEIGDGEAYSSAILDFLTNGTGNSSNGYFANFCNCINNPKAVELATNLTKDGYDDWYLPHIKTLNLIYELYENGTISGFENINNPCGTSSEPIYVSSSGDGANAGLINFSLTGNYAGKVGKGSFGGIFKVRPVRKF
jgi:hypothetical protein